jgi:acyl carrier protein
METAIPLQVRNFIVENFLMGQDNGLKDSDSFLEGGIIDSTGVLQLVSFVEETFNISVGDDEVTPENMDSIDHVSAYVRRKLGGAPGANGPAERESVTGGKV